MEPNITNPNERNQPSSDTSHLSSERGEGERFVARQSAQATPHTDAPPANKRPVSLLHTFKGDVEGLVKKQKLSLMKMAAAQADANKKDLYRLNRPAPQPSFQHVPLIAGALTILGLVALVISYLVYFAPSPPSAPPAHTARFFFVDKTETVDLTDKDPITVKRVLTSLRDAAYYPKGTVAQLIPTVTKVNPAGEQNTRTLSTAEWFAALGITLPRALSGALKDTFMFGWYAGDHFNHPFLVLKTTTFDYAFAGLLQWEHAIESDLFPLFTLTPATATERYGPEVRFVDSTVENVDVRLLKDGKGNIRLLYGFVKKDTLLLTTGIVPFIDITKRLRATP